MFEVLPLTKRTPQLHIKPTASLGLLELTSEDLLVQAEGDPAQVQAVVAVHLTA